MVFSSADRALAERIERCEADAAFTLAKASGVDCEPIAGGAAVFAGVGAPFTHALGIGMSGEVTEAEHDRLERFFRDRGSPVLIDLCPLADTSLIERVQSRGYKLIELNNVLARRVTRADALAMTPAGIAVEMVVPGGLGEWSRVVAAGFSGGVDADTLEPLMRDVSMGGDCFLGRADGQAIAGAAMGRHGGVAFFFGDATLPAARARGAQRALIAQRLARAASAGCDLAYACVLPGSQSHRNYERAGFQLVYMRVNVKLD